MCHLTSDEGGIQFVRLIKQCENLEIVFCYFGDELDVPTLVNNLMAMHRPIDNYQTAFSHRFLKYVIETSPLKECHGTKKVNTHVKIFQH